jgi:siroheme decarboxylase
MCEQLLNNSEQTLLAAIQNGFPLTPQPYDTIAQEIGWSEAEVISALSDLSDRGVIKRLGVIIRHRELGFTANAMVVWNIPDEQVVEIGKQIGTFDFVTLCYHRRRSLPRWPYNLYCMIHGRKREQVLDNITSLETQCGLGHIPKEILFSRRRFKQQGARYFQTKE